MILTQLTISGFLSYREPVELDFTGFDLACISGANGAGKSSLLDAVTWALFGEARRRDDAVINSASKTAQVRLDFRYEGLLYRVQRAKTRDASTLLEFMVQEETSGAWRPLTEHTLRDTQARIQSTLRLDYETFINASFFLQGKADLFAQQRPGDRKRILGSILGLDAWEGYRQLANQRRRSLENDATLLSSQLVDIEEEFKQESTRKARLAQLQASLAEANRQRQAQEKNLDQVRQITAALEEQRKLLAALREGSENARQRASSTAARISERRAEHEQAAQRISQAAEIEAAHQNWNLARQELQRWEEIAVNFRQFEAERTAPLMRIETQRSRLDQEIKSLQAQEKVAAETAAQLEPLQSKLRELEEEIQTLQSRLDERASFEIRLADLQEERATRGAENQHLFASMNQLKERIQRLGAAESDTAAESETCPLCGQPLSAAERVHLIQNLELEGKKMADQHRSNQAWLSQVDGQRSQIQNTLNDLRKVENDLRLSQRQADALLNRLEQMRGVLQTWEQGGALRLRDLTAKLEDEDFALEDRADLARVDQKLKGLGYDAVQHDAARSAEQAGRGSEEALRRLEAARASLSPLEREIKDLAERLVQEEADLERQLTAVSQAETQYASASAGLPDIRQAENDLFMLQTQENNLRHQVGGANQEVEVYKNLRARQTALQEDRKNLQVQIGQLKSLEQAFGKDGVPALLIEQALPEIEAQANDILDRLTAGNMSVKFATQKEYKDKNREDKKETLDILISDSAGTREYELFSGGEAFRVNFAIRLALSRVLAQRAGARLQTLVIDEGFGSQDGEGRQRLVQAINLVRDDFAKVLIITHLEELKDAFTARIEVEKTSQGSRLRVMT